MSDKKISYRNERFIPAREKRTGAMSHFHGTGAELKEEVSGNIPQRIRTFSQAGRDEIIAALDVLTTIKNIAIVVHGASGCAMAAISGRKWGDAQIYSTDFSEKETILGGGERLSQVILRAAGNNPDAVFIVGTPVTAISNDDVLSVIRELSEEISIKLIFLKTDGFQTKTAMNGYDVLSHALLRNLTEKSGKHENFLNVISFSEGLADLRAVLDILDALNIRYNILPRFSSINNIKNAGTAAASIALNPDEGGFLARELEDAYGVKYLKTNVPVGTAALRELITLLGRTFKKEEAASDYITGREEEISAFISKQPLCGKRVFVQMELAAVNSAEKLIGELGGELCGFAVPYVDEENRRYAAELSEDAGNITAIVGNGQPFELVNALLKSAPDFYLGENAGLAAYAGIPSFSVRGNLSFYGYNGFKTIAKKAKPSRFPFFEGTGYYKRDWLKKRGNWYVKKEVK